MFLQTNIVFAQQDPNITMYMNNILLINPAYAGSQKDIQASLVNRNQWVSFAGAPALQSFNIHSPLNYNKIGLGLQMLNQSIGAENYFSTTLSYAYKINFSKGILSFGLNAGIKQYKLNFSRMNIKDLDDKFILEGKTNVTIPDIGSGIFYKSKKFNFGFSALHLAQNRIAYLKDNRSKLRRHYYLFASHDIIITERFKITPNVLIKYVEGAPLQVNFTTMMEYRDRLWTGLSYRTGDALCFFGGLNFKSLSGNISLLRVGYSYDWTTSGLTKYNSGTHEIILNCNFKLPKSIKKLKMKKVTKSPLFF